LSFLEETNECKYLSIIYYYILLLYIMNNKMMSVLDREWQNNPADKKPFYTIVLNSLNPASKTGAGAELCSYRFDWGAIMPDVPYEVHMTYIGEVNNINMATLPMVYIDFGVPSNVYEARNTTTAGSSLYVGFLESYLVAANSYLHAEDGTNAPIYLNGRPRNSEFSVRVLSNDGIPFTATGATALGEYIMNLRFVPV
jgi:hypothetical protein